MIKMNMPLNPLDSAEFWNWFSSKTDAIVRLLDNLPGKIDPSEITAAVKALNPKLQWELGPGKDKTFRFVISPGGIRSLIPISDMAILSAPRLDDWEFFSCKPPKQWSYSIKLHDNSGKSIDMNAADWKYRLVGFAQESAFDVTFVATDLPPMDATSRSSAAYIVLDSIFGERLAIERFMKVSLITKQEAKAINLSSLGDIQLIKQHIEHLTAYGH